MPRLLILFVVVLAAACTGDGSEESPETTSARVTPVTPVTTGTHPATTISNPAATGNNPATTGPGQLTFEEVMVELSSDGSHLVDEEGMSLYVFTLDESRTSSCTDACAETWPPLLGDPVAGDGVDPELLGNAERGNGSIQVTYGGQPLYTYTGDAAPGDTTGHGFNDVWFLVGPDGNAVESP